MLNDAAAALDDDDDSGDDDNNNDTGDQPKDIRQVILLEHLKAANCWMELGKLGFGLCLKVEIKKHVHIELKQVQ